MYCYTYIYVSLFPNTSTLILDVEIPRARRLTFPVQWPSVELFWRASCRNINFPLRFILHWKMYYKYSKFRTIICLHLLISIISFFFQIFGFMVVLSLTIYSIYILKSYLWRRPTTNQSIGDLWNGPKMNKFLFYQIAICYIYVIHACDPETLTILWYLSLCFLIKVLQIEKTLKINKCLSLYYIDWCI